MIVAAGVHEVRPALGGRHQEPFGWQPDEHQRAAFLETGECGGFMIAHPPKSPRDLLNIIDFLVPELQRRGRFRTEYSGRTLRDNLADH